MAAIVKGIILLWYGPIGTIPEGWALCDGTNDTPDLRDRFLVGAGSTYAVDATGGAATHSHTFTSDGHSHTMTPDSMVGGGAGYAQQTSTDVDTGATDTKNHLPPYHALAYIMKL